MSSQICKLFLHHRFSPRVLHRYLCRLAQDFAATVNKNEDEDNEARAPHSSLRLSQTRQVQLNSIRFHARKRRGRDQHADREGEKKRRSFLFTNFPQEYFQMNLSLSMVTCNYLEANFGPLFLCALPQPLPCARIFFERHSLCSSLLGNFIFPFTHRSASRIIVKGNFIFTCVSFSQTSPALSPTCMFHCTPPASSGHLYRLMCPPVSACHRFSLCYSTAPLSIF